MCQTLLMVKWMDDLRFSILFNTISVISGQLDGDYERFHAVMCCLGLNRFSSSLGLKFMTL